MWIRLFGLLAMAPVLLFSSVKECWARSMGGGNGNRPIVLIIADKINTQQLFNSNLPNIKKILSESACGLMMIRSAAGHFDSNSGYLSLGSGERSRIDPKSVGACHYGEKLPGGSAEDYLKWSMGKTALNAGTILVPDMGLIQGQPGTEQELGKKVSTGLLGDTFKRHGWKTFLLGNSDVVDRNARPAGFLLADHHGVIDDGNVSPAVNKKTPLFPYLSSFNSDQTVKELTAELGKQRLIVIEFGDFFRLDYYREEILPRQFQKAKQMAWANLDRFLGEINKLQQRENFALVMVAPSVAKEAKSTGNLLAPIVIDAPGYPSGMLTSGTTKWRGLVANNDFLPTMLSLGQIDSNAGFSGRSMRSEPVVNPAEALGRLNGRLMQFNLCQRPFLNWYMGLITLGWIGGVICLACRCKRLGNILLTLVLNIPLVIILIPLLPESFWGLPFFLFGLVVATTGFSGVRCVRKRVLSISGAIWIALIIDQACGWHLIRYSALGYNAMGGARYYGMGNEYMGIFLAVTIIFAHLLYEQTRYKWPIWIVLISSIGILSVPRFGAKFGGILAGTVGFLYYIAKIYKVRLTNKKFWFGAAGFGLLLLSVGIWDSLRPVGVQSHIGRFVGLFWKSDYGQVFQIILRKLAMNFKLTLNSPWMRINLLALVVALGLKFIRKCKMAEGAKEDTLAKAILATGISAYLVNDAGVLALATCLAFGFSYLLLQRIETLK